MISEVCLEGPADNVSAIVDRTKVLVEKLKCALIHQDNLTKDCFDTNATELSKTVENQEKLFLKLNEEYLGVKEEVKDGEKRLKDIQVDLKELAEENRRLKEVESNFLNSETLDEERRNMAQKLRETLHTYKLLTGVRFDFNENDDILSGYVAICGDKPANCTVRPFEVETGNAGKDLLWSKINEACLDISS